MFNKFLFLKKGHGRMAIRPKKYYLSDISEHHIVDPDTLLSEDDESDSSSSEESETNSAAASVGDSDEEDSVEEEDFDFMDAMAIAAQTARDEITALRQQYDNRAVNSVTTAMLPPPPTRSIQNTSGCDVSLVRHELAISQHHFRLQQVCGAIAYW